MGIRLETASDRAIEQKVAQRLAQAVPGAFYALPPFSAVDYMQVQDGVVVGLWEIKSRKETPEQVSAYGDLLLKQNKWLELRDLERKLRIPVTVVFAFMNGDGPLLTARPALLPDRPGVSTGRRDRNLETDLMPVVLLDWHTELNRIG